MTLDFENPPITELVIGIYFDPPLNKLRAEHIGLFWAAVKTDFPHIEQAGLLLNQKNTAPVEILMPGNSGSLFPRFWFKSADDVTILQIQSNALLFNWRKRGKVYPHFDSLKKRFDEYYNKYVTFVKDTVDEAVVVSACDLTYVNLIEQTDYWKDLADTKNVIPSFRVPDSGRKNLPATACTIHSLYSAEKDLDLHVKISNGKHKETEQPILYYEMRATGPIESNQKADADKWFERAHNLIGECFVGMTDSTLQKQHWKITPHA